ncbi:pyridoxamine 5'-phosphate oxidase family protein [Chitinophaga defluvii]|uniref:Pyridoxamine 5'-phosphate oxidase family protein n=1 Tax=Chitinophaga defluvii TaxID=3163343 RepID=A0ABV2T140_9BACT
MLGQLTIEEIDLLLSRNLTGRIGCTDGSKVYIVPVSYAFNGTYIIAHSKEGMKISMMRQHPQICFQVDEIDNLTNWRSIILWGTYEEVIDQKEKYYAMKFLIGHLMKQKTKVSETAGLAEMHHEMEYAHTGENTIRPIVYRIRIKEKTGRFEKQPVD